VDENWLGRAKELGMEDDFVGREGLEGVEKKVEKGCFLLGETAYSAAEAGVVVGCGGEEHEDEKEGSVAASQCV
jgi:hypothetical protein